MSLVDRVVMAQVALGGLAVIVFFCVAAEQGLAASVAWAAVVLPSGYYAWVVQRTYHATRLLLHGVIKVVLTATLIALGIIVFQVKPLGFFVTLAVTQLGYLAPPKRPRGNQTR